MQDLCFVGVAHDGLCPGLVGVDDGQGQCAPAGVSGGLAVLELRQCLIRVLMVEKDPAQSIPDIGHQRLIPAPVGQV